MILASNRGFGDVVDTSGVVLGNASIPGGTYQAAVDQLPVGSGQSLTDMITASLQNTPATGTAPTNWALWAAGALFLVLFVPLLMSGGRH